MFSACLAIISAACITLRSVHSAIGVQCTATGAGVRDGGDGEMLVNSPTLPRSVTTTVNCPPHCNVSIVTVLQYTNRERGLFILQPAIFLEFPYSFILEAVVFIFRLCASQRSSSLRTLSPNHPTIQILENFYQI